MGATLAYINGGDPLSGGGAAVAAEKAAQYLTQQYNDGKTAIDPQTGEFNPNLLPEHIKEEIKSTTGVIAAIVGATGDGGAALNAQIGGVLGQNAVENNTALAAPIIVPPYSPAGKLQKETNERLAVGLQAILSNVAGVLSEAADENQKEREQLLEVISGNSTPATPPEDPDDENIKPEHKEYIDKSKNELGLNNAKVFRGATRNSSTQIEVNMSQEKAINNLIRDGFIRSQSTKNPEISILTKGNTQYTFYPSNTGRGVLGVKTGMPSAELRINGIAKPIKIRFTSIR